MENNDFQSRFSSVSNRSSYSHSGGSIKNTSSPVNIQQTNSKSPKNVPLKLDLKVLNNENALFTGNGGDHIVEFPINQSNRQQRNTLATPIKRNLTKKSSFPSAQS